MWRAIWFLIVVTALAGGGAWLADRPGMMTLDWGAYRIETSAAVLAFGVALVAAASALVYRVWLFFRRAPGDIRIAWRTRRRNKGLQALTKGMVAVAAGDPDEARKQARRAEGFLQDPPLTMLLSAQAAQLAGDDSAAERFFRAMTDNRETEFLGLRGLLNQAMKRGDRDEALILARRAYRLKPDSEWVSASLFELQTRSGQWNDARVTAREAVRHRRLGAPEGRRRDAVLACQMALDAEMAGDHDKAVKQARMALGIDDELVPAVAIEARALLAEGRGRKAVAAIERVWPKAPHGDLVALYIRARAADDALTRVKAVNRLAGFNPAHRESRLAQAAAALDADLWGEARKYLDRLIKDEAYPTSMICRLMARLEEAEHGDMARAHEWLMRASTADPDPAWVCDGCGRTETGWQAVCGHCHAFDSYRWQTPPHPARPTDPLVLAAAAGGAPRSFIASSGAGHRPGNTGAGDDIGPPDDPGVEAEPDAGLSSTEASPPAKA